MDTLALMKAKLVRYISALMVSLINSNNSQYIYSRSFGCTVHGVQGSFPLNNCLDCDSALGYVVINFKCQKTSF